MIKYSKVLSGWWPSLHPLSPEVNYNNQGETQNIMINKSIQEAKPIYNNI